MRDLVIEIPEDVGYLLVIGDTHLGDKSFSKRSREKLVGYLEWVKENPNSRVFLNGDLYNVAGINEKTSPFETEVDEEGKVTEYAKAIDLFKPYAKQIIGATDGNHEGRLVTKYGFSPLQNFCRELDIHYCGWSCGLTLKVGLDKKPSRSKWKTYNQQYRVYLHHTTGGGQTIGSKMNRVEKLKEIVVNADVYCGSHNHQLGAVVSEYIFMKANGTHDKRKRWFVDCGGYLDWEGSYAERSMLPPTKIGSARIRFDGKPDKRDIHISI